tara:strand:- start:19667 stop:21301 length:1635 start_codon:yes stop_codon:yes gene_type:complete
MTIKKLTDILTDFQSTLYYYRNKNWHEISPQNFILAVNRIANHLQNIGLKKGGLVGIMAPSSPQWLMVDFAIQKCGGVSVPLFHNMSTEHMAYILKQTKMQILFTENGPTAKKIQDNYKLKSVIPFWGKNKNQTSLQNIIQNGDEKVTPSTTTEKDIVTIIYTSGSTGYPKGVMLTHSNLTSQIKATKQLFPLSEKDVALSFLPLAHVFERMVMSYYLSQGIPIYFNDHMDRLKDHLSVVRPTLMTTVPRFLEKIYKKSFTALDKQSSIKRFIGSLALKSASKNQNSLSHFIFDKLVYKKIQQKFGGNLRMLISGGAALSTDIERFFNNVGLQIYQGYGLTESSPVVSANYPGHNKPGTCGQPFPDVHVKTEKDNELLVKGPNIMQGYYKNEKATKDMIKNGWLKTGDLATIDKDGYIKLIGRKKESFKTSTGKYVVPVPIEQLLQKSKYVDYCLVIAEGKPYVSCLLFINEEYHDEENLKPKIKEYIKQINTQLDHWEKVRNFKIIKRTLTIEAGDITPSMKVRRYIIEKKYKKEIQGLYDKA